MFQRALTFNDITLADIPSDILPTQADLTANVTATIKIKKPIMSAAMDTVTEAQMAVAMAKNGCLGVLHRNLSIDEQVEQLCWVRRQVHNGGKIENPITFLHSQTLADLQRDRSDSGWIFTSFPIVDENNVLQGMVSKDELAFIGHDNPPLSQLMKPIDKLIVGGEFTTPDEAFEIMFQNKIKKLPLTNNDKILRGMYVWSDVRQDKETREEFSLDADGRLLVAAAVGPGVADRQRIDKLVSAGCKLLVIDCSHGACSSVVEQLKYIRREHDVSIIAGNIASFQSADYLLRCGYPPDALKVGIGPGTICTTRKVTGHGVPQITAVSQVCKARDLSKLNVPVIADGGITCSGDIVKALAVGADCVMLGSMLAGTDESPGEIVTRGNKKYKNYRGMGSRSAMNERSGSRDRYFKSNSGGDLLTQRQAEKIAPEGVEALVEYKGSVSGIINEMCGGVRSGMAHSNATCIDELKKNAVVWEQTVAGFAEGNPHNIIM